MKFLRGESSAESLKNDADFCQLVIDKAAARRGLRPDQVKLSLMTQAMSDPAMKGADVNLTPECQGLH
ncbi:hypothetical protein [Enterovibrio sp. 27052020O]|uniref:hypothetical protein n=1 Tax=Enterovibrio sp. 27052020O TaxID=3241166 RepID=UPI00388D168C